MQTVLFFIIVAVLTAIAWEDLKNRMVHLFWFPVLFLIGFIYAIQQQDVHQEIRYVLINSMFLFLQALALVGYFILKHKRWINITESYLGWGDVLFILSILPFFSPVMFVLFYLSSLLFTIVLVVVFQWVGKKILFIPLAGIQSLCLLPLALYHELVQPVLFGDACIPLLF